MDCPLIDVGIFELTIDRSETMTGRPEARRDVDQAGSASALSDAMTRTMKCNSYDLI